ncbi:ABATE domain-containing protein [Arthrobacter castelli]|uniref:ABATE domain-containing protein n=1 Tax=Arthrobacter castelli TaxID=271431 RepID=UPI0003FC4504|nr:ABATE domain-containing protein [Arthrobacter castelli]
MTDHPLPPAPGTDEHVSLDFANSAASLPGERIIDSLDTPAAATEWLVERDLAPANAQLWDVCVNRLHSLRTHTRALLAARADNQAPSETDLQAVNEALTTVPSASLLHWNDDDGLHRVAEHPATQVVEHAMAALAADLADLLTGPDAGIVAACSAPSCNRYMVRTHARRHWCSTRCGDRVRAARAYARRNATEQSTRSKEPAAAN